MNDIIKKNIINIFHILLSILDNKAWKFSNLEIQSSSSDKNQKYELLMWKIKIWIKLI